MSDADSHDPHADGGPPSNSNLNERLARVETKQDQLLESTGNIEDSLNGLQDQHDHLWTIYSGGKWLIMVMSGGGVLALLVQASAI